MLAVYTVMIHYYVLVHTAQLLFNVNAYWGSRVSVWRERTIVQTRLGHRQNNNDTERRFDLWFSFGSSDGREEVYSHFTWLLVFNWYRIVCEWCEEVGIGVAGQGRGFNLYLMEGHIHKKSNFTTEIVRRKYSMRSIQQLLGCGEFDMCRGGIGQNIADDSSHITTIYIQN